MLEIVPKGAVCHRVKGIFFSVILGVALASCSESEFENNDTRLRIPRPVSVSEPGKYAGGVGRDGLLGGGDRVSRDALNRNVYDFGRDGLGRRHVSKVTTAANGKMVTLNFADASLREVVDAILGKTLEVPYVFDERVNGMVTARTTEAIPRANVIPVLENILALHGAALVKDAGVYNVVPRDAVARLPKSVVTAGSDPLPPGAGVYVIPLEHAQVSSMVEVMSGQVGDGSQLVADKDRNILIFTGPATEAQVITELASVLDVDALEGKSFALFPVKSASAENVVGELQVMFANEQSSIKFLPVNRLNAVLAVARTPATLRRVGKWVRNLDKTDKRAGQQTFVYYAKNSRASELASVLRDTFGAASSAPPSGQGGSAVAPGLETERLVNASSEGDETANTGGGQQTYALQGLNRNANAPGIRIVADESRNALVIMATAEELSLIREVLHRIDVMPLQVLIEATIAEVTLNDNLKYGVQWALSDGNFALNWVNSATGVVAPAFPGANLGYDKGDARAILSALSDVTEVQVVSSPQLMVLDNQSARLQIGDQVPVLTQSAVSTTDPTAVVVNSVSYVDTGVIFEVTPRVNASGLVTLDILQEVSDPAASSTSGIQSPTIQQRRIKSTVAVQSGATVALGGLIRERNSKGKSGVPGLMKVPALGKLFSTNSRRGDRTELLVMITPRVIRNPSQALEVAHELRERVDLLRGSW